MIVRDGVAHFGADESPFALLEGALVCRVCGGRSAIAGKIMDAKLSIHDLACPIGDVLRKAEKPTLVNLPGLAS